MIELRLATRRGISTWDPVVNECVRKCASMTAMMSRLDVAMNGPYRCCGSYVHTCMSVMDNIQKDAHL